MHNVALRYIKFIGALIVIVDLKVFKSLRIKKKIGVAVAISDWSNTSSYIWEGSSIAGIIWRSPNILINTEGFRLLLLLYSHDPGGDAAVAHAGAAAADSAGGLAKAAGCHAA